MDYAGKTVRVKHSDDRDTYGIPMDLEIQGTCYKDVDGAHIVSGWSVPEELLELVPRFKKGDRVRVISDEPKFDMCRRPTPSGAVKGTVYEVNLDFEDGDFGLIGEGSSFVVSEEFLELAEGYQYSITVDLPDYTPDDVDDAVDHPSHYTRGNIEVMDFIIDQGLNFPLGSAVKYICRAGYKGDALEDLKKARKNLDFAIEALS